jgi:hypothetical protein
MRLIKKKRGICLTHFDALDGFLVVFDLDFAAVFGFGFASLTGFIGTSQQIKSQSEQPQTSSTKTTRPHSSHSYFSPFFFAKKFTNVTN